MYQKKRVTTKRKQRRRLVLSVSIVGFLVLVICIAVLLRAFVFNASSYVSPLPVSRAVQDPFEQNSVPKLKSLLENEGIVISGIKHEKDAYVVTLQTKEQIFFNPEKDLTEQIASLQVILPRLTMEGKRFTRLDLRYDKPVVVFAR